MRLFSDEVYLMKRLFYGTFAVWAITACICQAAPEPAVVQSDAEWTADVRFEKPRQIMLRRKSPDKPLRFWYTILTITNSTDRDVDFYPKCELMTDTFQIISAGKETPAAVFKKIKKRHRKKYPFLNTLENSGNRILQGQDNTKDIAIIWPDFDPEAKNVKLFITGLSDETAVLDHPTAKDAAGKPKKIFLRKTLELSYDLAGDPAFRSDAELTFKGNRWVMR